MEDDMTDISKLKTRVKLVLLFFVVALVASGLTVFPIEWELNILTQLVTPLQGIAPWLVAWIALVNRAIQDTYRQYPFFAYGFDWLGFAHIVIGIAFWGPFKDPVKNVWVVEWGMIACVILVPLALIMAPLRGVPFFWALVDCAFGVFGIIPLWIVRRTILQIEKLEQGA
jgi:hypothetical protein